MKLWLTPDEELVLVHQTIQSSIILQSVAYEVSGDSHRVLSAQQVAMVSSGAIQSTRVVLGPALVESLNVSILSGTVVKGQVAVGAYLRRLSGSENLLAAVSPVVFPSSNYAAQLFFDSSQQQGEDGCYRRVVTGTNPAAGAECSDTVPTGVDWILESAITTLVTDATVANRRPHLLVDDGTTTMWRTIAPSDITASLTGVVNWMPVGQTLAVQNNQQGGVIPERFELFTGSRIQTSTLNIQAGDNYGSPIYAVMERLTLARG